MVEPITLGAKLVDVRDRKNCCCDDDFDVASIPESVCRVFEDSFIVGGEQKRVFVSIGIFSIIKLERKVQLLIPSYDFCLPQKECVGATAPTPYRPQTALGLLFLCSIHKKCGGGYIFSK